MKYQLVKNSAWKEVEVNGEMVEIPKDWSLETIKNIATVVSGGTPSTQNPNYWNGSLTWATPVEVGRLNGMYLNDSLKKLTPLGAAQLKNKKLVRDDLIVTTRGTVGNLALAYSDMYCNQSCEALRVKANNSPQYLYFFMKNHKNELVNNSSGTTFNAINKNNILDFFFIRPKFSEQTFIANLLTNQQNLIASYDTLITQHQHRLDYLSDELLSGRIRLQGGDKGEPYTMVRNTKWKEVEVNGEMVEIPEDWSVQNFFNVLDSLDSKRKALSATERSQIKGIYPYWGANSIIDYVNNFLINDEVILLGEDAAPFFDKSKKVAFQSIGKIWPNNHVHVLKPKNANSIYCVYILNSLPFDSIIGVTVRPKLTQKMMTSIKLKMPPLTEQTAIANILTQQENLITQYKTLRDLEQKRFTWLSDALLSGTYRVKELP